MFWTSRRTRRMAGVRFCDSCTEVTTSADRARRDRDRTLERAQSLLGPR